MITNLQDLAEYFERRALENERRARVSFYTIEPSADATWYEAKQDAYKNAAQKVRELIERNGSL